MDSTDASKWLQEILGLMGYDVTKIASHSLKHTFLGWCGKAGLKPATIGLLAGSIKKGQDFVANA